MTKPVNTKNSQFSGYSTIPIEKINIFDGIWKKMQVKNRDISIKAGYKKLEDGTKVRISSKSGEEIKD